MDYRQIYNNLIIKALLENRTKLKKDDDMYVYYEKHHILPKCLGGSNNKNNLVLLTANEHFVAHQLLVKIYNNENSIRYALLCMLRNNSKQIRNNKEYEWIRKTRRNIKLSEEQKLHLSKINLGKKLSDDHKTSISRGLLGHKLTNETKLKIGNKNSEIINRKIFDGSHIVWNKNIEMSSDTKILLSKSLKQTYVDGRELSATCFKPGNTPHNAINNTYYFKSPDDVIYKTDNITKFSKSMGLSPQAMACLHKGTYCALSYKGWTKSLNYIDYNELLFNIGHIL